MNEYLKKFREQYPEYDDMPDAELAKALHAKFYDDMPWAEFADKIGLDGGGVEGMLRKNTRAMGLDPDMSATEAGGLMATSGAMAMGGGLAQRGLQQGLGVAANAIRAARAVPQVPAAGGIVSAAGSPLMVPGAPKTALEVLQALARSPIVKKMLPYAKGATGLEVIRRLF
jgi:hypothetical protein